jgi:hypothetical protein
MSNADRSSSRITHFTAVRSQRPRAPYVREVAHQVAIDDGRRKRECEDAGGARHPRCGFDAVRKSNDRCRNDGRTHAWRERADAHARRYERLRNAQIVTQAMTIVTAAPTIPKRAISGAPAAIATNPPATCATSMSRARRAATSIQRACPERRVKGNVHTSTLKGATDALNLSP